MRGVGAEPLELVEWHGPVRIGTRASDTMGLVDSAAEAQLPPKELRDANHYWRINSTADAGYMLVVSDRLPMCHITGGGDADLQPIAEAILSSDEFRNRWEKIGERSRSDMTSTEYRNREDSSFTMVVSRASAPGQRRDRVQVLATATMKIDR